MSKHFPVSLFLGGLLAVLVHPPTVHAENLDRPISVLIRHGSASTELPLGDFDELPRADLRFIVSRGQGGFVASGGPGVERDRQAMIRGGELVIPSLAAGGLLAETHVELRSGETVVEKLRFVTLPVDLFDLLRGQLERGSSGVLYMDRSTIVVDEDRWVVDPPPLDYPAGYIVEAPSVEGYALRSSVAGNAVEWTDSVEPLDDYGGGGGDGGRNWDRCPSSICWSNPLPPGVVEWRTPDPRADGFSVKLESYSNVLHCPQLPKQGVDGVYKNSWGCNKALKIPDNCQANLYSSHGSCCCGSLTPLGYVCTWIDPRQFPDWPNCYGICS